MGGQCLVQQPLLCLLRPNTVQELRPVCAQWSKGCAAKDLDVAAKYGSSSVTSSARGSRVRASQVTGIGAAV